MAKIQLLDKSVCEQIAAGEVVERPASVVKELVENAIDAKARKVEIELQQNGLRVIRVTDDGVGIEKGDVKTAFLRHATSKLRTFSDLEAIATLGFRGEALAAICAVSRVRLITKTKDESYGTVYEITAGEEIAFTETGAPDGTTIYVSDLFFNTPARMKFLKSDVQEGNAVENAVEQQALAHPEVSFKLIRDGRVSFQSPGDGELFSAVYSVFPREAADNLLSLSPVDEKIGVSGYITAPSAARASRSFQYVFVNGRFVKSKRITAAVEEACRSFVLAGKYPCFAVNLYLPYEDVDINVHPAKTEVRFKNEREAFSAVYSSVKAALSDYSLKSPKSVEEMKNESFFAAEKVEQVAFSTTVADARTDNIGEEVSKQSIFEFSPISEEKGERVAYTLRVEQSSKEYLTEKNEIPYSIENKQCELPMSIIGEVFDTYIVAECGSDVLFVDKHAAHERILYEKIKNSKLEDVRQLLLEPVIVSLSAEEKAAVLENIELFSSIGFVIEDFADRDVAVREIPTYFPVKAVADAVVRAAGKLTESNRSIEPKEREWLLHSTACRAAIKAGDRTSKEELSALCKQILSGDMPKYCPHGRPVFVSISQKELESRFGRI